MSRGVELAKLSVLSIDPGETHCGMASFEKGKCIDAWESTPMECKEITQQALQSQLLNALIIEDYRLYPWDSDAQAFSQMLTVRVIGVLEWLWQTEDHGGCLFREQGAYIKKPTMAMLKARKIKSIAKANKAGGHALDAELHGYHFLMKHEEERKQFEKELKRTTPL